MTADEPEANEYPRPDGGPAVQWADEESAAEPDAPTTSTTTDAATFVGEDLRIGYSGTDEPVLDDESIRVPPGRVTALVGPNGSGKSTLLKGLATQLPLDTGRVLVDGEDAHTLDSKALARRLGLLSQENISPDSTSVEQLVAHGRYPHRGFFERTSEADRAAIDRAIELAGVDHLRGRAVGSLSGGQRQLVWIAMVLAQETDVLLLDEPTTFLDLHHQLEVMEIVETLRDESETTVVLVLHDIEQAARHADHLVALRDGSVYARGPPADVLTEDLLADVFRVETTVTETPEGPSVTPLSPLHE
ncbi:ABC transporter ATP-binding protein [Haloarchaeobius litoreus]|uniref:Cobalamin import ATP-binding protein BtuD n=1 Tax=Haloarchaeobius litoreus TaxID=755306 RepID=A0ABD6DGA5_9EURY|nr:ABC transporter ATP-binding protein [Haloarchaeobius litoreus]